MNCLDYSGDTKDRCGNSFARISGIDDLKTIVTRVGIQIALELARIFFTIRFVQTECFGSTNADDTGRAFSQFGAAVAQTIQLPFLVSRARPATLPNLISLVKPCIIVEAPNGCAVCHEIVKPRT